MATLFLFIFSLISTCFCHFSFAMTTITAMAKDQISCTMCSSCDNPCQPILSPPPPVPSPPPPSPPPPTEPNCPPPSGDGGGVLYFPPPPPVQSYYPPPNDGVGCCGGGSYYPPSNFPTPLPPSPFNYYSPPPPFYLVDDSSVQIKIHPFISSLIIFSLLFSL